MFLGLLAARPVMRWYGQTKTRLLVAGIFVVFSAALLASFYWIASPDVSGEYVRIAKNVGKHPPELRFMLFSLGGAFFVLGISIAGGSGFARLLAPITTIGKDALQSFVCHIFVLFVCYRYLLGYWHNVSYVQALGLTAILIAITAIWVKVVHWYRIEQH